MTKTALDVSVIICTYTEARWPDLVAAVESLHRQGAPAREIIVVVDHNQHLLERVRAHLPGVVVVENSEPQGLSGARNSGIAVARGALIAFLDDDATAEPDWLERFNRCFENPQVLGAGGTVEPKWLSKRPSWFPREFYWVVGCTYQDLPEKPVVVRNPYGGCACYRREVFEVVGGFRTDMGRVGTLPMGCEETELCIRASQYWPQKVFLYEPQARIHHRIPPSRTNWRYFGSRCFAEGLSKAAVSRYVGAKDGLATERTYIARTLLRGLAHGVRNGILHLDVMGFARAAAIAAGLTITVAGYSTGVIARCFASHNDKLALGKRKVGKVRTLLDQWIKANKVMLINAGSLIGTTVVTGVLGFAYWWVAARLFPPQAVGLASASISAIMLLGSICVLGLGTLLIGELPRQPGKEASLISAALILVGGVGACGGIVFALLASLASADFQVFRANIGGILLFAVGVSLTAVTIVLDQALIGLLKGGLQFWRNTFFAATKLVVLLLAGFWLSKVGETIYGTWAVGNVLSLVPLAGFALLKGGRSVRAFIPDWGLLRKLGLPALQHHMLNLILRTPTTALPVLVTILLSATTNAWFYVSWMLSDLVFIASYALTTVLYAVNSAEPSELSRKIRMTLSVAVVTSILANCVLQSGATQILDLFGHIYADQAAWSLRILGLAAFAMIIKHHYIAVSRIHSKMARAALPVAIGSGLELGLAALGAHLGGLVGLSLGWVLAVYMEAVFMFPAVYRATFPVHAPAWREGKQVLASSHNDKVAVENERV